MLSQIQFVYDIKRSWYHMDSNAKNVLSRTIIVNKGFQELPGIACIAGGLV